MNFPFCNRLLTLAVFTLFACILGCDQHSPTQSESSETTENSAQPHSPSVVINDKDHDGYPDGPDAWIENGEQGRLLYCGEDKNGNGIFEPLGADGIAGTDDDEYDPADANSHPTDLPALAGIDANNNYIPDAFEKISQDIGQIGNDWFADKPQDVQNSLLRDAVREYGDPRGGDASIAMKFARASDETTYSASGEKY